MNDIQLLTYMMTVAGKYSDSPQQRVYEVLTMWVRYEVCKSVQHPDRVEEYVLDLAHQCDDYREETGYSIEEEFSITTDVLSDLYSLWGIPSAMFGWNYDYSLYSLEEVLESMGLENMADDAYEAVSFELIGWGIVDMMQDSARDNGLELNEDEALESAFDYVEDTYDIGIHVNYTPPLVDDSIPEKLKKYYASLKDETINARLVTACDEDTNADCLTWLIGYLALREIGKRRTAYEYKGSELPVRDGEIKTTGIV